MKIVILWGVLLGVVRPAAADDARTCKATADCGANAVCTAEGKCVQLAAPQPTPPPDPNKPSDADMAEAKKHFDAGVQLYADGNYSSALAEFTEAWRLSKEPVALKNMGGAQQRLFLYVEALESLQKFVELAPDDAEVPQIKTTILELEHLVADIKLAITPKDGVTIVVDGKPVGTIKDNARMIADDKGASTAKPLRIAAGSRTIELAAPGYEPYKQTITLPGGAPYEIKADLKLIPTTGKVRITSPIPRAIVSIDGTAIGPVPIETELKGGGHTLEVTAPDYQPYRGELVVTAGAPTREVPIALDKIVVVGKAHKPWYKKWYVVAPLGAVVVGAGVGTYIATRPPDPVIGTLAPGSGTIK